MTGKRKRYVWSSFPGGSLTERGIGTAHAVIGLIGLALGAYLCIGLFVSADPSGLLAFQFIFPLVLLFSVVYFLPATIGGIGLRRGRPWARTVIIAVSALEALLFPIGTIFGGLCLWILLRKRVDFPVVTSPESDRPQPAATVPSVPVVPARQVEERFGCVHLDPIEQAMRTAGIGLITDSSGRIRARCLIDRAALAREYPAPSFVHYVEPRDVGPSPDAAIVCDQCRARIGTLHAAVAGRDIPVFPAARPPL